MTLNRFAGIPRGKPLPGSEAIAQYIWSDKERWRSALRLPRAEFGLTIVCGELFGFSGYIDHAFALRAGAGGGKRRRRAQHDEAEAATTT
jgi:hypothetical protein